MTKDNLIAALLEQTHNRDIEAAHIIADDLLLSYIADREIEGAYHAIPKGYA